MRTTIAIDADIEPHLRMLVKDSGKSLRTVVNELLRAGLSQKRTRSSAPSKFTVHARHLGFRAGVDPLRLNQLLDELDAEDFAEESRPQKK